MTWVDTHCHLHMAEADPADLLDRAARAGVEWLVCPGTDVPGSEAAAALARRFSGIVLPTAGLHPHEASKWPEQRDRIAALAEQSVAVGECGLDFYRNLSPPDAQQQAFRDQIALAVTLDKPLIVHCRDAFAEVYAALEETGAGPRTVLHCWTGGPRWTKRFRLLGAMFSFAGPVAFATGDTVRRGAAEVPPERALVETDTPYLSPPPHRHEPNEPARVPIVGEALADVWAMPVAEVARVTTANAERVFRGG